MLNYLYKNVYINSHISYLTLMIILIFFLPTGTLAQEIKAAPLYEPENPAMMSHPDMDRWSYVPDELQVSVGSIDERYGRHQVPIFSTTHIWKGSAWR